MAVKSLSIVSFVQIYYHNGEISLDKIMLARFFLNFSLFSITISVSPDSEFTGYSSIQLSELNPTLELSYKHFHGCNLLSGTIS
jgi:hypothetical protein